MGCPCGLPRPVSRFFTDPAHRLHFPAGTLPSFALRTGDSRALPAPRSSALRPRLSLDTLGVNPRTCQAVHDRTDPTWELQVHLAGGEIVRLLDGYSDAELQWLATALRRA